MKLRSVPLELEADELLCVVGPTGSQKTELALRICEEVSGEVIGADSVQIYRYFDIGSGKPTAAERARAAHHLVDVLDPREPIEAASYARLAEDALRHIRAKGATPVVCGGTFLWVRAVLYGLAAAPPGSNEVRHKLDEECRARGRAAMHARLASVDPQTAARLGVNDYVRVQRALEVYELTGRRMSELHKEHQAQAPRHRARLVGVAWPPARLEERIRARAESWLQSGWLEEVRQLEEMGLGDTRPMSSVGYQQVRAHLRGELERERLVDEIVRATKIYARRQRTWLRDAPVLWVEPL